MAIKDNNHNKWYGNDRDENVKIGLRLPLVLDNGELGSTTTTLDAVKQNILNLCSTEIGERVMQPSLGLRLKRFLFEPFNKDLVLQVQESIVASLKYWMPFVLIRDIKVKMSDTDAGDFRNTMEINVFFSLKKDPGTYDSVQVNIGE